MRFAIFLFLAAAISCSSASAQIVTSFDVDLSPAAQSFAVAGAATLELNYTIDGAGVVSLDAVAQTSAGLDASPARYNQIDNAAAGTTASAALNNTSFTLTFSGSGTPVLNFPAYDNAGTGAVLATPQGNASALEDGENVAFTVSGSATMVPGFALNLDSFSYGRRLAHGQSSFGVEDTSGTIIEQLVPNTSLEGTIDGTGISLAAGEAMTFRTISGNLGGAGLSGFEFNVTATTSLVLLGDVDLSGAVDFADIPAFIDVLTGGGFQAEADCDENGVVDFSDIPAFIDILTGG